MQYGVGDSQGTSQDTAQVDSELLSDYRKAPRRRRMRVDRTPFEEDEACQKFIEAHPGGATLGEIADYMGVTRERVRQIEFGALRKLERLDSGVLTAFFSPNVDRCSL